MRSYFDSVDFRAPRALRLTATDLKRGLIVGSRLAAQLKDAIEPLSGVPHDFAPFDGLADLAELAPRPLGDYDYLCVALSPRFFAPEQVFARVDFGDEAAFQALFAAARQEMTRQLDPLLRRASEQGMFTLVCDFLVPHQNPKGRLLRRHAYSNIGYFISRLNEELEDFVLGFKNAYILSLDEISATLGRRYLQDEIFAIHGRGGVFTDDEHRWDQERLEPAEPMSEHYESRVIPYFAAVWNEIDASIRSARGLDAIKLVLVDLDDTLWRGRLGEGKLSAQPVEGWPIGLAEALGYLRRRGVLLGIVSKNDEALVKSKWREIYSGVLQFEDFVVHRINWRPKPENVEAILSEVNLPAENVLFIDDNPTERQAVAAAFPGIRVLGSDLHALKQVLIGSPETQAAVMKARTGRDLAPVDRAETRRQQTQRQFLASLALSLRAFRISTLDDARFAAAFAFLNETRQFNTTGARWSREAIARFLGSGGRLWAIEGSDRFTHYGWVAIGLVDDCEIAQLVMSAHVVGMGVETAALWLLERDAARAGLAVILARSRETPSNGPVRQWFSDHGYALSGSGYVKEATRVVAWPEHIRFVWPLG